MKLYKRFIAALLCVVMMVTSTPLGFLGDLKLFDGFNFTAAAEEQTSEAAKYLNSYYNGDPYAAKIGLKAYLVDKDDGSFREIEKEYNYVEPGDLIRVEIWVQTNYFHSEGQIGLAYSNSTFQPTYQDYSTYDYYNPRTNRNTVFALHEEDENSYSGEGTFESPIYLNECVTVLDMGVGSQGYGAIKNIMPPSWRGEGTTESTYYSDQEYATYNYLRFGYYNDFYKAEPAYFDMSIIVNEYQPVANFYLTVSEDAVPGDVAVISIPEEGVAKSSYDGHPTFLCRYDVSTEEIDAVLEYGAQYTYLYEGYDMGNIIKNEPDRLYDMSEATLEFRVHAGYEEPALADYTALNQAKEEFESLNREDYTADSWGAAEQAYAEACSLPDDLIADVQNVIDEATEALIAAISSLILLNEEVDKTELLAAIQSAHALNEDEYTTDSWSELVAALEHAEMINGEEDVLQEEVDAAVAELKSAINSLAKKVDKTELLAAIQSAHALNEDEYTADSWSELVAALEHAEMINGEEDVLQAEVDAAVAELKFAINSLAKKVDKTALEEAIAMAEATENIGYTDDSWAEFQAALASAKSVYEDDDAVQEDIDYAEANLLAAISMLKEAESESPEIPSDAIASGTCGESLVWYITPDGELIIAGEGAMADYDAFPASARSPWGNNYSSYVTSVTISDGVTAIGECAFESCSNLISVTIPDSVALIGEFAFECCENLTSITIPDSVTTIGVGAFCLCTSLENIIIPDVVTTIGDDAFNSCSSLTSITIGNGVKTIGYNTFFNCDSLTSVTIPDSVITVSDYAFSDCNNLISVTIPDSVTSIGDMVFEGCISLNNITVDAGNIYYSSDSFGVLYNKDKTELIQYPIGNARTSFEIPDTVTKISADAFCYCENLESLTIPDNVTSIGYNAFKYSTSVKNIYYDGTEEQWNAIYDGEVNPDITVNFTCVPEIPSDVIASGTCGENLEWYLTTDGELIISGEGAMSDYWGEYFGDFTDDNNPPWYTYRENVKKVTIEDGVTTIGRAAFIGLDYSVSVSIPASVTTINSYALTESSSISVDENSEYFSNDEYGVLFNKDKTTLVQYPNGNARYSYTVPDGVTSITDCAFTVFSDDEDLFVDSVGVRSVTIPKSVKHIGSAFYHCCVTETHYKGTLTEWEALPDSGYSGRLFCNNGTEGYCGTNLTWKSSGNVLIVYGTGRMYDYTEVDEPNGNIRSPFAGESYSEVIIKSGVTSIGNEAFAYSDIGSIIIPGTVTAIDSRAFDGGGAGWVSDIYYCGSEEQWNSIFQGSLPEGYYDKELGSYIEVKPTIHFNYVELPEIPSDVIASGTCGESLVWYITTDGELIIAGSGAMPDYRGDLYYDYGVECMPPWFTYGENIKKVTIENGVTTIGRYAFAGWGYNVSVSIPASVTDVGFFALTGIENISVDENSEYFSNDEYGVLYNKDKTTLVQYPNGNERYSYTVPDGVTSIADHAFGTLFYEGYIWKERSVRSVTIPSSVTYIGYYAITECNVRDVIFKGTLEEWNAASHGSYIYSGDYAFGRLSWNNGTQGYCGDNLIWTKSGSTITISGSGDIYDYSEMDDIGGTRAPWHGYSLSKVIIESGVTSIGAESFAYCNIGSIIIPSTVTAINAFAFDSVGSGSVSDIYYCGTEEQWKSIFTGIAFKEYYYDDDYNMEIVEATIHYNWVIHDHNYTWVVETAPTTIQSGTKKKVCTICGETVGEAVEIPATGFVATNGMVVDYGNSIVFGLDAGVDSLDGYTAVVAEGCEWEYTEGENGFGTGTKAVLKNGAEIVEEYTVVIFGDIQGDGWYDGEDAFIANLIAKGVLDKDDVGEVIWTAADCNHDGVIDEADVDLLSGAGLMLNDVDQKRTQAELATDSAYIEYAMLIDQSAGMNTGFVTTPDADENVESEDDTTTEIETDTEESDDSAEKTDVEIIFANIFGFVKKIFNLIFSFIIK